MNNLRLKNVSVTEEEVLNYPVLLRYLENASEELKNSTYDCNELPF